MGRLEFRVFGAKLAEQRAALTEAFNVVERDCREDLYFLGGRKARAYKLRGGSALDLKQLSGITGGYQRWDVLGLCDLPASGSRIAVHLGNPDDLPFRRSTEPWDASEIAAAFRRSGYIAVKVRKSRTRFDVGHCLAEMTHVGLGDGADAWSVAIEGEDASALESLKETLCLLDFTNQSYPEWLARLYPLGSRHSG